MSKYICDKCNKEFKQKGSYTTHITKKTPCVTNIKFIIEEEEPLPIIFANRCELTRKSLPSLNCPLLETNRNP